MIRYWSIFTILCMGIAAQAQAVTVRSGEHGDFTRLVFSIGSNDWNVEQSDDHKGILVTVPDAQEEFDVSTVYNRIGKERIRAARRTPKGLQVDFGCDCGFDAFETGGGFLVIDVRAKTEDELLQSAEAAREKPKVSATSALPVLTNDQQALRAELTAPMFDPSPRIGPGPLAEDLLPSVNAQESLGDQLADQVRTAAVSAVGSEIIQTIANAATSGALEASHTNRPVTDPVVSEAVQDAPETAQADSLVDQLTDALTPGQTAPGTISLGGRYCTPDEMFAFSQWLDREDHGDISELFGEFDRIDRAQAKAIAIDYLAKGFGAEARSFLGLAGDEARELTALSYALDGEQDPSDVFANQAECDGPSAFWSLVGSELHPAMGINKNAVLQHFEALPREIRQHLGPLVARKLVAIGQSDLALDLARRLERMSGEQSPAVSLIRAEAQLANGQTREAAEELTELARQSGPEAHHAAISSIEAARTLGKAVPSDVAQLTEAFAQELQDHESGNSLWRAHVLSLLQQNQLEDAISAFKNRDGVEPDIVARTAKDLSSDIITKSEDYLFIKTVLSGELPRETLAVQRIGEGYIERLSSIGLLEMVVSEIEDLNLEGRSEKIDMIYANALFGLARYGEAELALSDIKNDEAIELRARIRMKMGDYEFAARLFIQSGNEDGAVEAAWLSEFWSESQNGQGARSAASEVFTKQDPDSAFDLPGLEKSEQLAESSMEIRDTVASLLGELTVSE